jgi:hypothetical protein
MPDRTVGKPQGREDWSLGLVFTLVLSLIIGSFMVIAPLVVINTDPVVVSPTLPAHKQDAETLIYVLTFLVLPPLWAWRGPVLADRIRRGPNVAGLPVLIGLLTGLLAGLILLVRASADLPWNDGARAILAAGALWCVLAACALFRASRDSEWTMLTALRGGARAVWTVVAVLAVGAVLTPVVFGHVDLPALLVGLLATVAIVLAYGRIRGAAIPRGWRLAIDGILVLLILLAIPDMVILPVEQVGISPNAGFDVYVIQFHQNLWLGAASQVLGGSALLVDTVSQYGIAPIYLAAAFFKLAPINHTTLGFFDAALSAGVFATGYLILRAAGVRQLLAAAALAVGVIALVWDLSYPLGGLLQHGALRFGLPILVVAFATAGARWPRFAAPAMFASLAVVGLSSIWALESFLYVSATWLVLILLRFAWLEEGTARLRWPAFRVLEVLAAWAVTQILFALVTLAASGSLPDWGLYLNYLRDFLTGDIGDLTYDVTRWSRGYIVAAVYIASAVGLVLITTRVRGYSLAKKPAMVAMAGLTGYGVGLFSYYDNRSLDHVLPYVSLPALLLVTIWLALCLELDGRFSLAVRRAVLGVACLFAALLVAVAWPAAETRSKDSLLAYALPGGKSLSAGFERLWDPPEFTPGAAAGERLIDQYMPDQEKVPVLAKPDLDVEILVRSGKINQLGITDAKEMSWVPGPHLDTIDDAVDDLRAGDLMLLDADALIAFEKIEKGIDAGALGYIEGSKMEPIQVRALERIAERFKLKLVDGDESGVAIVRLEPR